MNHSRTLALCGGRARVVVDSPFFLPLAGKLPPGLGHWHAEPPHVCRPLELEHVGPGRRDEVGEPDAVPEDAEAALGVLPEDVVVDLVEEGDHGVDGPIALQDVGVEHVDAELAVAGDVVGVVRRGLVVLVLHEEEIPVQ